MATKRVTQSAINWTELSSACPPAQLNQLLAFKSKSNGYLRKMSALPENPPKIDWSYYKSKIPNVALVETFEKQYNSLKIAYPTAPEAYEYVDQQEKNFNEQLATFKKESAKRVRYYDEKIELVKSLPDLNEWTLEEFAYRYPDTALDPLNHPTLYPHSPEYQHNEDTLAALRRWGYVSGPDCYHP